MQLIYFTPTYFNTIFYGLFIYFNKDDENNKIRRYCRVTCCWVLSFCKNDYVSSSTNRQFENSQYSCYFNGIQSYISLYIFFLKNP